MRSEQVAPRPSMNGKSFIKSYDPLPQDEDQEQQAPEKTRGWRSSSVGILMILEALVLAILFAGYSYWQEHHPGSIGRDEYLSLRRYNKTVEYDLGLDQMEDSPESEKFWHDLIDNNGVVSVPTAWAQSQGFSPSRAHPDRPDQSIYQIDTFHAIHCLYRIRSKLLGKETVTLHGQHESQNNTDPGVAFGHTLHCVNYIRQALMCHADLTLQGTKNMRSFIRNEGHQCRDFDSVAAWARRWSWAGHGQWLKDNVEGKVQ